MTDERLDRKSCNDVKPFFCPGGHGNPGKVSAEEELFRIAL